MSKGRRSQAKKGQQEMENGNGFSMLQEDDDQYEEDEDPWYKSIK